MSGHQKIIALQFICTNTNCFYKIIFAKLLTLNVLSIALYTFKNFNNIYILQNYLSCDALKIKSTQIIFKQETHSNIIYTLTIHKQTSLNFDDKKYIILAQTHSISITELYNNHPCQDIRKSLLYSLSVPTLTVSTKLFLQNY